MNTTPVRLLIATSAAAGLLALSAASASAAIACQGILLAHSFALSLPAVPDHRHPS